MVKQKIIKKKPDIYQLSYRTKMGSDARTDKLTQEHELDIKGDKQYLVKWIQENGDHQYVYIIRDRKQQMIASYCFKNLSKKWGPINQKNYAGGYKIGHPNDCGCNCCFKPVDQPLHPSVKNPNYD